MAKWSLKNRDGDNKPPEMPPAAENYYRAEKRDRMIGVWLLGLATLAVTVVLAFLLFLGGRWVYRQFTDNEATTPETAQTEGNGGTAADLPEAPADGQGNSAGDETGKNDEGTEDQSGNGVAGVNDDSGSEGVVGNEAATTDLPNTGPADTLALFLGVTLVAALVHRTILSKQA